MQNKLDYHYIPEGQPKPDQTQFRIAASSVEKFFSHTSIWCREKLLLEPQPCYGTGATLGTVVHYLIEQRIKNGSAKQSDVTEAMDYVDLQASETVDPTIIRANYLPMYQAAKGHLSIKPVALAEPLVTTEILENIVAGGSIDALRIIQGDFIKENGDQLKPDGTRFTTIEELSGMTVEIVDWKTTSALNTPTSMAKGHEWQLLLYSLVLKKEYNITVAIVTTTMITRNNVGRISPTTQKPMKDYPSTVADISKPVTQESLEFIESIALIIAHSVKSFVENPGLQRGIISQDARLITNTAQLPFKVGKTEEVEI